MLRRQGLRTMSSVLGKGIPGRLFDDQLLSFPKISAISSSALGFRINANIGLNSRGCTGSQDKNIHNNLKKIEKDRYFDGGGGFYKPRALSLSKQAIQEIGIQQEEVAGNGLADGRSSSHEGSSIVRFPNGHSLPEKIVVAVDVDEVLGNFVTALNRFIADRYSSIHSVSEYHVYEFCKIWNCSPEEADIRVHEFFKTSYFKNGIHPIPGARRALKKLSQFCNLSVVTSRQNAIQGHTVEWLDKHYPGLFQEMHFGNHFALDGESRSKSDICRSMGAKVLIDDNPRYAMECAEAGIRVLLFDYENSYPWCKVVSVDQHPLVTKVHNWDEVEQHLVSWTLS